MTIFAAATTTTAQPSIADKLSQIPTDFWWKIAIGIAVILAAVFVVRKVAKTNKVLLGVGAFVFVTIVGFNWIYERNEPKWATPAVNVLSGFLPSKGTVGGHAKL